MKKYFVDTENCGSAWLPILETLTDSDKLYILENKNSPNVSFPLQMAVPLFHQIEKRRDCIQFVHCVDRVAANGMDMELVSFMGSIIGSSRSEKNEYIIVSNDSDFNIVVEFWKQRGKNVRICSPGQTWMQGTKKIIVTSTTASTTPVVADKTETIPKNKPTPEKTNKVHEANPIKGWEKDVPEKWRKLTTPYKTFKKEPKMQKAYSEIFEVIGDEALSFFFVRMLKEIPTTDALTRKRLLKKKIEKTPFPANVKERTESLSSELEKVIEKISS